MQIMMVDDSPTQRALWMYSLSSSGVNVITADDLAAGSAATGQSLRLVTAKDGEQALAMLQTRHFTLLITDIDMPGLDGWQLANKAQAMDARLHTVIVSSKVKTGEAPPAGLDPARTHIVAKADRERAVELVLQMLPSMRAALRQ